VRQPSPQRLKAQSLVRRSKQEESALVELYLESIGEIRASHAHTCARAREEKTEAAVIAKALTEDGTPISIALAPTVRAAPDDDDMSWDGPAFCDRRGELLQV
jgi:hypothetical protein